MIGWMTGVLEIERDGCVEPDNDPPQAMGDESLEVNCSFVHSMILRTSVAA